MPYTKEHLPGMEDEHELNCKPGLAYVIQDRPKIRSNKRFNKRKVGLNKKELPLLKKDSKHKSVHIGKGGCEKAIKRITVPESLIQLQLS